jgi:AraC-like DNA-binding protein
MRPNTLIERRRLYLLARAVVARHYRRELTLAAVARALASSPRQVQRAYAQFGEQSFNEDLRARRMSVAAGLLFEQPAMTVADVARLVGYRQPAHFARAFRRSYGLAPASFRAQARAYRVRALAARAQAAGPAAAPPDGHLVPAVAGVTPACLQARLGRLASTR